MTEIYDTKKDKQRTWREDLTGLIRNEWDNGKTFTSDLNDLYEDLYLMLRGRRPKKKYDYQSDITLRKAFQVIWTGISYVSQKIYGAHPVIGVDGYDDKGCWQRERLLEIWMAQDKYFTVIVMGLLRLFLNGVAIIKKGWKQELVTREMAEPQGTTNMVPSWQKGEMTYQAKPRQISVPIEDRPADMVLNNKDVVCDWLLKPGQSITEGRFIIHRELLDLHTLMSSKANYKNLDEVDAIDPSRSKEAEDHQRTRQVDSQESPPEHDLYQEVEIFERVGILPVKEARNEFGWEAVDSETAYDTKKQNGKIQWRQMICTMAGYDQQLLIRFEPNPYGTMNYVDAHMYFDPERWQSEGMVEPAKDIFIAQDDNVNAMFDEIWRNLMPPILVNKYMPHEWDTIKWAPSQIWQVAGNPNDSFMFPRGSEITRDAWQKHLLLEGEIQAITKITPPVQGMGKEKTATAGVLNAQFSTGLLDFLTKMIEVTWLIPSSKLTLRFAQMFAHPLTFIAILGEPFKFDRWQEEYKFQPAASAVQLPEQREREIQEDIQLIQIVSSIPNPNTSKVVNYFLANILRNRNRPQLAQMFDEGYFEPSSEAGNMQMLNKLIGPGTASNEEGVPMSLPERTVRGRTAQPRTA